MDAFFASVEQLDHPEYRGKPVIVGGRLSERRGVVSTASYEARAYGVHSAMPLSVAARLCPNGIYLPVRMERYHEKSEEVMSLFRNYSPDVQQISVDEAFVDLTGTERLFGPPIETARRIKDEVREKTGLTVSVGIASTKYVAKIASGLKKPDGFCVVPEGGECDFMLSLPLEKVWGAGAKTLEKLRTFGFKTTKDIFDHSKEYLQGIFGNAMGTFLYNAVRGNEDENFNLAAKSHSISSETTFPYDLMDMDAIENALYRIASEVQYRSMREEVISKTVCVKIRYEDFSTVSVQNTAEDAVSSTDDLFSRAKELFQKKYDKKRGVRLLGIALSNVYPKEQGVQGVLFDDMNEKKRKLENAIFEASKKNPGIKIEKASVFGKSGIIQGLILASIFSILSVFPATRASAESVTESPARTAAESERATDGAGGIVFDTKKLPLASSGKATSLFEREFGNKNVEFLADGFWKSTVTETFESTFGFDKTPTAEFKTPVFVQTVDLSLWLMLNKKYYIEATFADGFEKNTVALGYMGTGYLKSARMGNRGIVFPSIYSVDQISRGIGGGDNQAPGISLNWAGKKWRGDFAFRYDMLEAQEKTWYGMNAVSENNVSLSSFNTGNQYAIPQSLVQSVKDVFVENAGGSYKDAKGRTYKKLDSSQYVVSKSGELLISRDAKAYKQNGATPNVAVSFSTGFESAVGSFDDASSFLGSVQAWFRTKDKSIDLKKYAYNFVGTIDGESVLVVQSSAGFSPFICAYRYDSGLNEVQDAAVASKSTRTTAARYSAVSADISHASFYQKKHTYTDITSAEASYKPLSAQARFPLADLMPEIYLTSSQREYDYVLRLRTYTAVSRFDIGIKAVPGTVRVYKNGVIDSGATYDKESGTVTLSTSVGATDHIHIEWYKESTSRESGAFAAAGGFKYDFTDKLSADISASSRWTYASGREFADSSFSSPGFASLAQGITYKTENLELSNVIAASLESENTTGTYRILGMDDASASTNYLKTSSGVDLPSSYAPSLNLKNENSLALEISKKGSVSAEKGVSDAAISGYALPVSWDFSSLGEPATAQSPFWAAEAVTTSGVSGTLANASTFSIAVKIPESSPLSSLSTGAGVKVYLQLGVQASKSFSAEESELVPTWLISQAQENVRRQLSFGTKGWQQVQVILDDADRARIASLGKHDARIIVTYDSNAAQLLKASPALFVGPYEATGLSFAVKNENSDVSVSLEQQKDASLSAGKINSLNSGSNYVQKFQWKYSSAGTESEPLTFTKYFKEIDLTNYTEMHLWMNFSSSQNAETDLSFTLDRLKENGTESSDIAIRFLIPSDALKTIQGWHEVTVDLDEKTASVAGKTFQTTVDTDIIPTRFQIVAENNAHDAGDMQSLSVDELYLSGNKPFLLVQDKAQAKFKKQGDIVKIGGKSVLKDLSAKAKASTAESVRFQKNSASNLTQASAETSFTLANLKVAAGLLVSSDAPGIAEASHSVSTASPILRVFSLSESYRFEKSAKNLQKANSMGIDLSRIKIPLKVTGDFSSEATSWSITQNAKEKAALSIKGFSLNVEATEKQKIPTAAQATAKKKNQIETSSYGESWKDITAYEFDRGDEKASKREIKLSASVQQKIKLLDMKPKLSFQTGGIYKSASAVTFSDTTVMEASIPFTVNKNSFSIGYKRTGIGTASKSMGGDYISDSSSLFSALSDKDWLFLTAPMEDLFSGELSSDVAKTSRSSQSDSVSYAGTYGFSWKRDFSGTKHDFFIPSKLSLDLSRKIEAAETKSDLYEIEAKTTNNALNMFGSTGLMPFFKWYEQDEFYTSLSTKVKIPRETPGNTKVAVAGYIQANMYLNAHDTVVSGVEGSFEDADNYSVKLTAKFKRNVEKSIPTELIRLFKKDFDTSRLGLIRYDSGNFTASRQAGVSEITQKIGFEYTHGLDVKITNFLTVNSSVGLTYSMTWNKSVSLGANASLGATVKF